MKNGSTHLAHKLETAVDLKKGAVLGVPLHGGAQGDTKTIEQTLEDADNRPSKRRRSGRTSPHQNEGGGDGRRRIGRLRRRLSTQIDGG